MGGSEVMLIFKVLLTNMSNDTWLTQWPQLQKEGLSFRPLMALPVFAIPRVSNKKCPFLTSKPGEEKTEELLRANEAFQFLQKKLQHKSGRSMASNWQQEAIQ